jgi:hypothetical protein
MRALVELVGALCELMGALLMANALLGLVRGRDVPHYLWSALINGKLAAGFERVGGLTADDHRQSLRGLALIALGFVLKVGLIVWNIVAGVPAPPTPAG